MVHFPTFGLELALCILSCITVPNLTCMSHPMRKAVPALTSQASFQTTSLIALMDQWSVHVAELISIFHAISSVLKVAHQHPWAAHSRTTTATTLCDSKSALQTIQNPGNKSGQQIIHAILQAATEIQTWGITLRLQQIPGHCDNPGNDTVD